MARRLRSTLLAMLLGLLVLGCGDTSVLFFVNTGTVASNATCSAGHGRFDLLQQGGLVILVIITSDTTIFRVNGSFGTCTDLSAGIHVAVHGTDSGGQINAREIDLQ